MLRPPLLPSSQPSHHGQFSLNSLTEPVLRVSKDHGTQDLVVVGDLEEAIQRSRSVDGRRDEAKGACAEPHGVGCQHTVSEVDEDVVGVRLRGDAGI